MKLYIYRISIAICILLSCAAKTNAQSTDRDLSAAKEQYSSLNYISAIPELKKVLKTDSNNIAALEMIAYSYKMIKNYDEALFWYEKLTKQKPLQAKWVLYYAEALANKQQYERSEGWYRKYLAMVPGDNRAVSFSKTKTSNLNKNTGNWKLQFTNLNSQGSDYAPTYYKNGLIFSSNKKTPRLTGLVYGWDNAPFTDLYFVPNLNDIKTLDPDSLINTARGKKNIVYRFNDDDTAPTSNDSKTLGLYNPTLQRDTLAFLLSQTLDIKPVPGNINTKYHEGTSAVFPDGSIIFTRNNYEHGTVQTSKDGINKLKLFIASGNNLNTITPFPWNSNEYAVGHPTLSKDGTILVFASDMPGGYGGTDLYYCVRSGNSAQWTRPVNLGKKINTEGNEMFPFLDKDGNLYFSSTGHPGLGGLDIFEVDLKEMKAISTPRNLGVPINSATDDFGFIKSDDGKTGFLSSNRRGNDDIYKFERATYRILLEGTVTDARTRLPLPGSRILMRHLDGTDTIRTNARGEFKRELPKETDYETTTQKIGYVSQLGFVTSLGITQDSTIRMDIRLNKTETAQQYVLNNCDSLKKVFAVKNIYYDLDRYEIRPDARPALDELAALMRKYPEITIITSSHCDSRASEEYNRRLSLNRGANAKAYLVSKGIRAERIKIEYYGKTRLVNRCYDGVECSEADQQLNRRTEFDVILNGVNITRQNCNDR
ncbi:OmpA family protein [Pedobacter sp. MC2016-24]|uniref:OmpA family protein n=1 Tax=Pedobacter sp. MC2016-24 TaxID=2780090 RepID=UPI00188061B5|nr:OmpA family protein [Pedobacter sp. MC2016-24]MBE9602478.1 PD40 domain-containing protein [Pedobacter sp. MC2016-24]